MEDQKPRLVRKQVVAKREGLNQKLMFSKQVLNCGGSMKKLM